LHKTFKYRLKDKNTAILDKMARSVNFVWNYCNETAYSCLEKHNKWISGYDLCALTKGCSKELLISGQTIQFIAKEYASKRIQARKKKLKWRSKYRSLGWVPFNGQGINVKSDLIIYNSQRFRFWKSREIFGKIKSGSFFQDSQGRWYVCFVCEVGKIEKEKPVNETGIDLGLKTIATLSNGLKLDRANITSKYAEKLSIAQRAGKKRHVSKIHAKIKNTRKDFNHKQTTILVNSYGKIFVGDVSSSKLKKTRMAKSVSDAGWSQFKSMLAYKAIALGVEYKEVKENFSSVTCSGCFERTGPSGLSALGVREWTCKCGTTHDRDVNAAINILRFGHESPIKGKLKA
jgi:putative transposase